jgi:hypothetical protein
MIRGGHPRRRVVPPRGGCAARSSAPSARRRCSRDLSRLRARSRRRTRAGVIGRRISPCRTGRPRCGSHRPATGRHLPMGRPRHPIRPLPPRRHHPTGRPPRRIRPPPPRSRHPTSHPRRGSRGPAAGRARPTGRASCRFRHRRTGPGSPRRVRGTPGRSCRFPRSARASGRRRTPTAVATAGSTSSARPDSPSSRPAQARSCSPGRSAPGASCRWITTTACAPPTSR